MSGLGAIDSKVMSCLVKDSYEFEIGYVTFYMLIEDGEIMAKTLMNRVKMSKDLLGWIM